MIEKFHAAHTPRQRGAGGERDITMSKQLIELVKNKIENLHETIKANEDHAYDDPVYNIVHMMRRNTDKATSEWVGFWQGIQFCLEEIHRMGNGKDAAYSAMKIAYAMGAAICNKEDLVLAAFQDSKISA